MAQAPDQTQTLSRAAKILLVIFNLLLGWSIALTLAYFVFGLNTLMTQTATVIAVISAFFYIHRSWSVEHAAKSDHLEHGIPYTALRAPCTMHHAPNPEFQKSKWTWLFSLLTIGINGFLLVQMFQLRTDAPLVSPWQLLTAPHFLLFFISSLFLVLGAIHDASPAKYTAFISHAAVMWSVAAAVYGVGFGFDPYIHQAAENYILNHGRILPVQFMYTGQYVIIAALSQITRLSPVVIDIWFLPVLAATVLPLLLFFMESSGGQNRLFGFLAVFCFPLAALTVTIPYGLALFLLLIAILLSSRAEQPIIRTFLVLSAVLSVLIHPLIGIPQILYTFALLAPRRCGARLISGLLIVLIPVSLFIAFCVYTAQNGSPPQIPPPPEIYLRLRALFNNPYGDPSHPWLNAGYALAHVWPIIIICLGCLGFAKKPAEPDKINLAAGAGVFLASTVIGLFFWIPDIIASQQFEFALRLQDACLLFFLPGVIRWLNSAMEHIRKKMLRQITSFPLLATIMVGMWHLTYPQWNVLADSTAPSVSQTDLDAITAIHQDAQNQRYIVLSPQMLSAASLRILGFEHQRQSIHGPLNPYAIPTGGRLYTVYLNLLQHPESAPQIVGSLFSEIQTDFVYAVIPRSWDPNNALTDYLGRFSDKTWSQPYVSVLRFIPAK